MPETGLDRGRPRCDDDPVPLLTGAEPYAHDGSDVGVLLCHGFTGTPQSLRPWAEHLAGEGFTVRLPRLPGHGTRWQDLNATAWPDWYDALDAQLHTLRDRCRAVVVAGLSMGGGLALRLAQQHGDGVAGLVLVNPAVALDDRRLAAVPVLRHLMASMPGPANDIRRPGVRELAYDRAPLHALHSMLGGMRDVVRDLPAVTQPVLLLRSLTDHVVPASSSALVLSRISSTDVTEVVLADSYHVATLDHDAEDLFRRSVHLVRRVTAEPVSQGRRLAAGGSS